MYADDVVIFLTPHQEDLILTGGILEIFAGALGLKTNAAKCMISPIKCDLEATVMLLRHFPGKIDPFPVHYLGIPLGLKKLSKMALQPVSCSTYVDLGDGRKALFWVDRWLQGKSLSEITPCLCAAVGPCIKKQEL